MHVEDGINKLFFTNGMLTNQSTVLHIIHRAEARGFVMLCLFKIKFWKYDFVAIKEKNNHCEKNIKDNSFADINILVSLFHPIFVKLVFKLIPLKKLYVECIIKLQDEFEPENNYIFVSLFHLKSHIGPLKFHFVCTYTYICSLSYILHCWAF